MTNLITAEYDDHQQQLSAKQIAGQLKRDLNYVEHNIIIICTYFPGWCTPNGGGPNPADPWSLINTYAPTRKPILGYYDETLQTVCDTNLTWMKRFGIDVMNLDWFHSFSGNNLVPQLDHVLKLYKSSKVEKPRLMVQWANQTNGGSLNSITRLETVWKFLVDNVFSIPGYYTVDNCPVLMLNSLPSLISYMAGTPFAFITASWARMKAYAVTKGWNGVQLMAGQADTAQFWTGITSRANGYDGVAATNIFYKTKESDSTPGPNSTDYAGMHGNIYDGSSGGYRGYLYGWTHSGLSPDVGKVWVPVQMGWDNNPWTGGVNGLVAEPTIAQLADHFIAAKNYVDTFPDKTQRTILIQAWNESGEGNRLQPEIGNGGFTQLELLKNIFAR